MGTEYVAFKTPLPLEGKVRAGWWRVTKWGPRSTACCALRLLPRAFAVRSCRMCSQSTPLPTLLPQVESYMAKVVDKMRSELRGILADAVGGLRGRFGQVSCPFALDQCILAHALCHMFASNPTCPSSRSKPAGAGLPLQEAGQVHLRLAIPDNPGGLDLA